MDPADGRVRFTPAHRGGTGVLATAAGRRRASALITENADHLPADLLEHVVMGIALCDAEPMIAHALEVGCTLEAERIACPVRVRWGDGILVEAAELIIGATASVPARPVR